MACQELRIANLENQKNLEANQDGFIKSYTYSNLSIFWFAKKKCKPVHICLNKCKSTGNCTYMRKIFCYKF